MRRTPSRQRGAALLVALLTLALVATFAATALWRQWRGVEVETAERSRTQAVWVLVGALDWARLILREDARAGGVDHLAEPWAVPLQEARLSTFLAANAFGAGTGEAEPAASDLWAQAFLSGRIEDAQAKLNLNNLVEAGRVSETALRSWTRLFQLLGLPPAELSRLSDNLQKANDLAADAATGASQAPLAPHDLASLRLLGLSDASLTALRPYITLLPARTPVNLNTAPAEVIYAAVDGIALADAQRLVTTRRQAPFRSVADAQQLVSPQAALGNSSVSVASRFFEVWGRLRLERTVVEEHSLVRRDAPEVKTVWRERVAPSLPPAAASQATR